MPTLFISYKRGTAAVAPLMERLRAAHYRLWFDRDEIHLGDPNWRARIDQGIQLCDGLILNLTPAACASEPVQYEVKKALELGKPIFPIVLEKIEKWGEALTQVGLTPDQHTEDFTDVEKWNEQVERLLRDLEKQGLRVTPHDRRQERDRSNPNYVLHQRYLKRLVERISTLSLAQINPDNARDVELEKVYVDSPTPYTLTVDQVDWKVTGWGIDSYNESTDRKLTQIYIEKEMDEHTEGVFTIPYVKSENAGFESDALEVLIGHHEARLDDYRSKNPYANSRTDGSWKWYTNTRKDHAINLHLNHLAAARSRLVILGAPGSGKSTFVKYLALCLAGSGIDDWTRNVNITSLGNWTHGALTPIYIELRRFVASKYFPADVKTPATADHLWQYILHELLGDDLAPYADDLQYDLEHGHALLVLDGLDEVPYPEGKLKDRQNQLINLAQSLNTRYASSRVIVASRPYAYEGWTVPEFTPVSITEFEESHRIELAKRLYAVSGLGEDAALEKAQALNKQLKQIDLELKDRPLFVTLMATIYLKGESEGLPTRRGALYRESILLLLDRWTQGKANAPSLQELLGTASKDDLYNRLAQLAYEVHAQYGERQGAPEIPSMLLESHLMKLGRKTGADPLGLYAYLSENAGVLVSPGQDDEKDVFHFAHRTFQEYLAGAHLVSLCLEDDSFQRIREHIMEKPQAWRVPCTLAGDVLADTGRRGDLWDLLDDLLDDDVPEDIQADDPQWWTVWLASVILEEQSLIDGSKLRRSEQAVGDQLRDWIVKLIETPQALDPVERAACGRALGFVGDPRAGIGLDENGLPDIYRTWCVVEAGNYPLGGDEDAENSLPSQTYTVQNIFKIAKYPVTYAQFVAFVKNGYTKPEYWTEAGLNWKGDHTAPIEDNREELSLPNHPRIYVRWYEAVAFCRWLTEKYRALKLIGAEDEISLPTEEEWEAAARGKEGWQFSYGNTFDTNKGNVDDAGIGQTSAVGLFPFPSPCDTLDMSGNVWEWTRTIYEQNGGGTSELEGNSSRVMRGGFGGSAFFKGFIISRCASRERFSPIIRSGHFGFRVVVRPRAEQVSQNEF